MSERMNEAKLSSLRINNVELSEITIIYEKNQVLNIGHSSRTLRSVMRTSKKATIKWALIQSTKSRKLVVGSVVRSRRRYRKAQRPKKRSQLSTFIYMFLD